MADPGEVQLKRGVLELCVLAILAEADSYAYEIAQRMAAAIDMGEGTVYPLVKRMQAEGLLTDYLGESPAGPPRRYYRLTDAGRDRLLAEKATWARFVTAIDTLVGPRA